MKKSRCRANGVITLAATLSMLAGTTALAWDGSVSGTINTLDVTAAGNYALRVTLNGVSTMCNGGASWAWLNETGSNYKTYAAALMMAKAQGTPVLIYTNLEYGHCRIGYISLLSG